ncbi:DEKNAAC104704 [Brettanomyces naardenensis]|uniref:DEKNAAC104704 n=1 Tax=Brettanomyces naardenensis TaxID=13370 RepID=A0A448YR14_BRENA|nr:DEKNAAC104704 [Brettanomyces naardenensis]
MFLIKRSVNFCTRRRSPFLLYSLRHLSSTRWSGQVGQSLAPNSNKKEGQQSENGKKNKKIVPPSVKDSQPFVIGDLPRTTKRPQENAEILASIEEAVKRSKYESDSKSMWKKFGFIFLSSVACLGCFVVYQTYNGKPAFFPIWFTKVVPLDRAEGVNKVDLEKLKASTKDRLLTTLSMNSKVRLLYGLPLRLGDFDKFEVNIEYRNYTMEGIQFDFTKNWFKPDVSFRKREIITIPENFNGILEPLKANADVDVDSFGDEYSNQRGYSILIEGRIKVIQNENTHVDEHTGAITFAGVVDFDHTKTIKLVNVILSFKRDGSAVIEKLW